MGQREVADGCGEYGAGGTRGLEGKLVACAAGFVASSAGARAAPNAFFSASAGGAADDPSSASEADDEATVGDDSK